MILIDSYPVQARDLEHAEKAMCPVSYHATRSPECPAIRLPDRFLSYRDLDRHISSAVSMLTGKGFSRGTRIALLAVRSPETVVWLFAAIRSGLPVLLISDSIPSTAVASFCEEAAADVLISDTFPDRATLDVIPSRFPLETGSTDNAPAAFDMQRAATLLLTSGSGGRPRIAVHSVNSHLASASASAERVPFNQQSCWLASLPLYHIGGLAILFRAFTSGGSVYLPGAGVSITDSVHSMHVTHVSLVETQLRRLLRERPAAPEWIQEVLVGGGRTVPSLIRRAVTGGYPIRTTYGMTEFSSQMTTSEIWTVEKDSYSCGRPVRGVEIAINEEGEILGRAPALFMGYLTEDGPKRRVDDEGWFPTGDLGRYDDGELYVLGRKDEMFISGGENIQPEEIEIALLDFDEIERAVVVPVEDEEFGFRPLAFITWRSEPLKDDKIKTRLSERLPKYKLPVAFISRPEGDESGSMKADRKRLRSEACLHMQQSRDS